MKALRRGQTTKRRTNSAQKKISIANSSIIKTGDPTSGVSSKVCSRVRPTAVMMTYGMKAAYKPAARLVSGNSMNSHILACQACCLPRCIVPTSVVSLLVNVLPLRVNWLAMLLPSLDTLAAPRVWTPLSSADEHTEPELSTELDAHRETLSLLLVGAMDLKRDLSAVGFLESALPLQSMLPRTRLACVSGTPRPPKYELLTTDLSMQVLMG
mmetsp:Transcript_81875/g.213153  ORF Transcript_81875/g.213153 Transcript_81875/m.213153 type:complete len:212 (+) Transcript_81875:1053-1688(+)